MAMYSAGRRRTMIILLLSSVLLITLDLRGNAVFDASRSGFEYALRPFEIAGDVITRPAARAWRGMTDIDELETENQLLQQQLDAQRSDQIAAQNALIENRDLRALLNLESLAAFDRVTASIIGSSPSNFDQRVEIDRGSLDGLRVGMPVLNSAGLIGKITNVFPETAIVMLVTDPQYHVPVKVVAEVATTPAASVPNTVPSGLAVENVTTTIAPPTTPSTLPLQVFDADGNPMLLPPLQIPGVTTTTTTTTTTTMPETVMITRETGELNGFGADRLPRVRFIADSPQFGRIAVGDAVLTSGGSLSLAPPDIPIGQVANVIQRVGTAGLELEIELSADLDRLIFLSVILYVPPTEAPALR